MLLSPKRLLQLIPVLLIIILVIAVTSYRDSIVSSLEGWATEQSDDTLAGRVIGTALLEALSGDNEKTGAEDGAGGLAGHLIIETEDGSYEIDAEIADTEEKRIEGLMDRESLCEDCGMLFVFETDSTGGFWMKDCLISLDILFIDEEGLIVDMKENFEPCPAYPCPSYVPEHSYRYALELNGGWVEGHNVDVGDSVEIT